ncbi:hypothetical protein [Pseudoalteromonas sp. S1608]|uniref:hypothetical protein n=1 Tax=Pseudoalteromonas sp. S1608 TaxID=579504 RepID=UPI00110BCD4E|nr:hypothetical protein [Pseudoalteromonas sp. S1608]TMP75893.1 hypothetical protein CWB75_03745 [Pseudoalteromonas sp. S1608]
MNIEEIAEYVWSKSQIVTFGEESNWNEDLFTLKWAKEKPFLSNWKESKAGWYWFSIDMDYDELHGLEKPPSLPDKGCNIGSLTHINKEIFGGSLLCKAKLGDMVIYNGHEANITSRIRAHFALNNNKTGALGLKHFPLSQKKWIVRYFSSKCFADIGSNDKKRIELLMNSYSGRCAVESAWRVKYGWPVLCKE